MYWPRTKGQKVPKVGHFWSPGRGPIRGWECRRDERLCPWVCSTAARAGHLPAPSHLLLTTAS